MLTSSYMADRRSFALLAPEAGDIAGFSNVSSHPIRHATLLAQAQKLRGKSYFEMGALDASQLTSDGRQISDADERSWHLLTLDERGQVVACLRYLAHPMSVSFPELILSHSALAKSERWGQPLREAVARELRHAR